MKIIIKNHYVVFTALFLFFILSAGIYSEGELCAAGAKKVFENRDDGSREELFFTYVGVTAGGGIDRIEYRDWISDSEGQGTKNITGYYMCGGALLDIFVNFLIGEFSIQYINNDNSEVPVGHMIYDASGKYAYRLNDYLSLTGGAGLYIETRPATRSYDSGAGFNALLGAVYNVARDWKLIFDITGRFGSFGVGEESIRQSYGAKIGIVYKVGRI